MKINQLVIGLFLFSLVAGAPDALAVKSQEASCTVYCSTAGLMGGTATSTVTHGFTNGYIVICNESFVSSGTFEGYYHVQTVVSSSHGTIEGDWEDVYCDGQALDKIHQGESAYFVADDDE